MSGKQIKKHTKKQYNNRHSNNSSNNSRTVIYERVTEITLISYNSHNSMETNQLENNNNPQFNIKHKKKNNNNNNNNFKIYYEQNGKYWIIKNTKNNEIINMNKSPFNYFGNNYIKPVFTHLKAKIKKIKKFDELWEDLNYIICVINSKCDCDKDGHLKPKRLIDTYYNEMIEKINYYSE
jgi:predicted site-specific integrase-resolvase